MVLPGVDYKDSFSSTPRFSSVRLLLALSANQGLTICHADFETAYLYGRMEEEIHMEQPEGFVDEKFPLHVCLLLRGLYGHPVSGRKWQQCLRSKLLEFGLTCCVGDENLYFIVNDDITLYVLAFVDDLMIAYNKTDVKDKLISFLRRDFKVEDLGRLSWFLGMSIEYPANDCIVAHQRTYAESILKKFQMDESRPVSTPMTANSSISKPKDPYEIEECQEYPYRELVGSLMYLAVATRPDIATAVSIACQYMQEWGRAQIVHCKHILRYLRRHTGIGLCFSKSSAQLCGYCDASWGDSIDDRRSRSGYVFILGNCALSWNSRLQSTVALSSTEAEYMAMCEGVKEAIYLKGILTEIKKNPKLPIIIFEDNNSAMNPVHHKRTTHIDIRYHFIRKHTCEDSTIKFVSIPTNKQVADHFTKGLPSPAFLRHLDVYMGYLNSFLRQVLNSKKGARATTLEMGRANRRRVIRKTRRSH